MKRSVLVPVLVAVIARSGLSVADDAPVAPIHPAPAFTARQLQEGASSGWLTNGGDLFNQRHSPLTQIDPSNVSGLKAVWRASLRGSGLDRRNSGQAQSLVHDGTIYTITGNDDVFAISVETGQVLWEHEAHLKPEEVVVCCGWTSRGVAMGDGKIFVGQLDNKVVALDQRTGEIVWSVQSETLKDGGYTLTAAPLYYNGLVIQGHAGGDMGMRGRLKAFDARTGKLRWVFNTIPGPGEPGHETWPADSDVWKRGGAAIWQTPAIDPELGLVIFSTDNPAPDMNGAVRAGDNLYSASIIALDVATGKYRWHFQEVHHDIWDYSAPNPVVLFDAVVDGRPRKGVVEVGKDGYVYILDRTNGTPLIGIVETPVMQSASQKTAATQPIPVGDDLVAHRVDVAPETFDLINEGRTFTPFEEKPVVYTPVAGVNWPPSSYDPASHTLFVCANEGLGVVARTGEQFEAPKIGEAFLGGAFGRADAARRGILAAVDVTTNRLRWRRQWSDGCVSGTVHTASGLLFSGRSDGRFMAFSAESGKPLWDFQTDAAINAPATVFDYKGTEYVAVLAAGAFYSAGRHGDGLWLFSLKGTKEPLPAGSASLQAAASPPAAAPAGDAGPVDVAHGRAVYQRICIACHGVTGQGGHGEGAPLKKGLTAASVLAIASSGRREMPSFGPTMSQQELRDVAAYITQELIR